MARHPILIPLFLVLTSITIASSIIAHHYLTCGRFADIGDILHHEYFASIMFAFAIGIIVTIYALRGIPHYG